MSVLRTAVTISGILVGIVVLVFLLAMLVRRDERPILTKARAIAVDGSNFWFLAIPAWFGGVSGLVLSAGRPVAPTGMRVVSIAILTLGFVVAALPIVAWSRRHRPKRTMSQDTMLATEARNEHGTPTFVVDGRRQGDT